MIAWAQGAAGPVGESLKFTPQLAVKMGVSFGCAVASLYFLNTGRRQNSIGRLMWAAVMAFASLFAFI